MTNSCRHASEGSDALHYACSATRDHHLCDLERRTSNASSEHKIAANRFDVHEHPFQISGYRNLFHGISQLAIFDPEPAGTARIITGYHVNAEPDQLRDVEAVLHTPDNVFCRRRTGHEIEICWSDRGTLPHAARCITGRGQPQLFSGIGVEQVTCQHAFVDDRVLSGRQSFPVEWP